MAALRISVFTHIFYDTGLALLRDSLLNLAVYNAEYFFSISTDCTQKENIIAETKKLFPAAYILETTNIGKDIGGKLALLDLYIRLNTESDYMVFLHDKLSPQALNGEEWREQLLKIATKENIPSIIKLFESDNSIGAIGNKDCIFSEYRAETDDFLSPNNTLLKQYITRFNIHTKNYAFVAGTMFWVRSKIITSFFSKYSALEIRKNMERGNVTDTQIGTHTHTMERFLGFIVGDSGHKLTGI